MTFSDSVLGRMLGGSIWLGQALFAPWTLHPRMGFQSSTEDQEEQISEKPKLSRRR